MIAILIGFISGIISGMGIGGGTILIPALVYFQGINQQQAQAINLIYFLPTAITAIIKHKKNDVIETSILKSIVPAGLLGAAIGSLWATAIEPDKLRVYFGIFLFVMGINEIFKGFKKQKKESESK